MGLDKAKGVAKRAEIVQMLSGRLAAQAKGLGSDVTLKMFAEKLVDACCTITPPDEPEAVMYNVTMSEGGGRGGRSRKLGNLALNMRKLVATVASGALAVVGITASPWTAPLGALVLWDAIWSKMEVDIQEREASTLWAMWLNRNEENHVPKQAVLSIVNGERQQYGRQSLSSQEVADALAVLTKLECIEEDGDTWWLREWVQVQFE